MTALLYFAGLVIGVSVFIYLYSLYNTGVEKIDTMKKNRPNGNGTQGPARQENDIAAGNVSYENLRIPPGERICPICRTPLSRFQPLYASRVDDINGEQKLLIYGCEYCHKKK